MSSPFHLGQYAGGSSGAQRRLLPSGFTWQAYQTLLADPRLVRYYANTILYAVTGTGIMLFCTMTLAYTLIHPTFGGRRFINVLLVITMFFSGGMVPTYLLIKNLGMYNTIWAMVLPGAVSAWNVIVVKTFFKELPGSLLEAAFIDGAGHFTVLLRIILPLSRAHCGHHVPVFRGGILERLLLRRHVPEK